MSFLSFFVTNPSPKGPHPGRGYPVVQSKQGDSRMRILCGLGIAVLVSGCLSAEHHGGSSPSHSGTASNGARWNGRHSAPRFSGRSEEHTSELQSLRHLVCRLLL